MPQLNPTPWFAILVFSWLVFLAFIPTKIMGHTFNNEPNPLATTNPQLNAWAWPWY
uniref:ATP synthase complex subunit 8 n=1 Tax=Pisodonophis cancrivorus TaxID=189510 RepID=A0A455RHE3_9TELE|nr:ATPase subunit 8 [Pisodonophis cancrivorus]